MGTPQGAVVSPLLANVYLHYVLRFVGRMVAEENVVAGDMVVVRYADDFVMGFEHKA